MDARLRALLARRREEAELEEEIRFHLDMETEKLLRLGWGPEDARREAYRRFGGVERMKERTRDARGVRRVEDMAGDVIYALRALARAPGSTAVTLFTLAVGIGATTAMYTIVDGVLLRPLPYPAADRLVTVAELSPDGRPLAASYLNFADWRAEATTFDGLAAYTPPAAVTALTPSGGARAVATRISADLFRVAGVAPFLGRVPAPDEHRPGGPPVAVVGHAFWSGPLGAPAELAGVTVAAQGTVYDVVGVMPPGFGLPARVDLWTSLDRQVPWTARANHVVGVLGRLSTGTTPDAARRELDRIHAGIRAAAPEVESPGTRVVPLLEERVGDARTPLALLLGAAAFLLLVACANVASTVLARGTGRRRELAVRRSLGAGRSRLIRQLLVENATLGVLGGLGALAVARGLLFATRAFDAGAVPRLDEVGLDGRVLAVTAAVAVGTGILCGVLPAFQLTGGHLGGALRAGVRGGADRRARRSWTVLMAAEVALAVVLLAGSALLLRSLAEILDRDVGYRTDGVVTGVLHLPPERYGDGTSAGAFVAGLVDGLDETAGVERAGVALMLPVRGSGSVGIAPRLEDGTRASTVAQYRVADRGFFEVLRIPLRAGRLFDERDVPGAPHAAVVDVAMAERMWPGRDPVGQRFDITGMDPYRDEWLTVVGVVDEVRDWSQSEGDNPTFWVSARQRPAFLRFFGMNVVALGMDEAATARAVREVVDRLDPDVPVRVRSLRDRLADSAGDRRFTAFVLGAFAAAALVLAAVGVYGIVAYGVSRRRREMGLRLALGASPRLLRTRVQAEALRVVAAGAALGLAGALVLAKMLRGLLFGVGPGDPVAMAAGVATLAATAWLASWIPARRATRVDPAITLRDE